MDVAGSAKALDEDYAARQPVLLRSIRAIDQGNFHVLRPNADGHSARRHCLGHAVRRQWYVDAFGRERRATISSRNGAFHEVHWRSPHESRDEAVHRSAIQLDRTTDLLNPPV